MAAQSIQQGLLISISTASTAWGVSRDKIRTRLGAAGVSPAELRKGNPVYRLADVVRAMSPSQSEIDPDAMTPFERKAHYQAQIERLKVETEAGQLIPVAEVQRTLARAFAAMAQLLDTIPDILERDAGVRAVQLVAVEKAIDAAREDLYLHLVQDTDLDDADVA